MTNIYTIYDSKAEQYHLPFYAPTDGVAIRLLEGTMREPGHDLVEHPEDYMLFRIGTFNPAEGTLEPERGFCVIKCIEVWNRVRLESTQKERNLVVAAMNEEN